MNGLYLIVTKGASYLLLIDQIYVRVSYVNK